MPEDNVVELVSLDTLPFKLKLMIGLLGNIAALGAAYLVEKGYVGSLAAWHQHKANIATETE